MRTIKFRGRTPAKKWVYGFFVHDEGSYIVDEHSEYFAVASHTVGQFTGLYDFNGKEIYEGDIVKWGHKHCHEKPPRVAIVEFNPDICFRTLTPTEHAWGEPGYIFRYGNFAYKETNRFLEVVGNVHDNDVQTLLDRSKT